MGMLAHDCGAHSVGCVAASAVSASSMPPMPMPGFHFQFHIAVDGRALGRLRRELSSVTVIPEPSTAALMLLAMLGVLVLQAKGGRRA